MIDMRRKGLCGIGIMIAVWLLFPAPARAQLCQAVPGMGDLDSREELRHPRRNIDTEYILFRPENMEEGKQYPLLIFLHGEGDRIEELGRRYCKELKGKEMFVAFLQGPLYVRHRGRVGYGWFVEDRSDMLVSLQTASEMVSLMIRKIEKKYPQQIDENKISIGGYSQGALVAFYVGLRSPRRFARIFPVAGQYMPGFFDRLAKRAAGEVEIFIQHGDKDLLNPLGPVKEGFYTLQKLGVTADLQVYPLTHQITREMMASVLEKANK